jgi:hypothetical protein
VPKISFSTTSRTHRLDARQSTGEPVVGFFVWTRD